MSKINIVTILLCVELCLANVAQAQIDLSFNVNGVSFAMLYVEGGTFQMGSNDNGAYDEEKPVHSVTLSSFYMAETEVTKALWEAVMGDPFDWEGIDKPAVLVSYDDIVNRFIPKLNSLTGVNFRLPTEAEWEYAARGGCKSHGYKYSGGNDIDAVAWYDKTTHEEGEQKVKTKRPNELGLYDMSGNVWEWCKDWYGDYDSVPQTNPQGPLTGSYRVLRGGCWFTNASCCRLSNRGSSESYIGYNVDGFRLALSLSKEGDAYGEYYEDSIEKEPQVPTPFEDLVFTINGVSFVLKPVEGGTFQMGAQAVNSVGQNYDSDAYDNESPVHTVKVSSFYMAETEVTQSLWKAVTGEEPVLFSGDNMPMEKVSWEDCQEFINKLNSLTGKNFRLPTEAEWEFAARGGNKTKGYKYAGGKVIEKVAVFFDNSVNKESSLHDFSAVKTKRPNELGLYDMSGNVAEWCQDRFGDYDSISQINPQGPSIGGTRVLRGGGFLFQNTSCRVSFRDSLSSCLHIYGTGFRLVLPL